MEENEIIFYPLYTAADFTYNSRKYFNVLFECEQYYVSKGKDGYFFLSTECNGPVMIFYAGRVYFQYSRRQVRLYLPCESNVIHTESSMDKEN